MPHSLTLPLQHPHHTIGPTPRCPKKMVVFWQFRFVWQKMVPVKFFLQISSMEPYLTPTPYYSTQIHTVGPTEENTSAKVSMHPLRYWFPLTLEAKRSEDKEAKLNMPEQARCHGLMQKCFEPWPGTLESFCPLEDKVQINAIPLNPLSCTMWYSMQENYWNTQQVKTPL